MEYTKDDLMTLEELRIADRDDNFDVKSYVMVSLALGRPHLHKPMKIASAFEALTGKPFDSDILDP